MSGILHKVKEAVAHHGHHQEASNKPHTEPSNHTYTQPPTNTHNTVPHPSNADSHGASTTTSTSSSSGPYLHDEKPTFNSPFPGDDGISPRTSTVNTTNTAPATHDHTTGPAPSTAGPHSSNTANKADPRVDSDMSSFNANVNPRAKEDIDTARFYNEVRQGSIGGAGVIHASGSNGPTTTKTFDPHAVLGSSGGGAPAAPAGSSYNAPGTGTGGGRVGPHGSDIANKMDPRVDSDMDGSRTVGAQRGGY